MSTKTIRTLKVLLEKMAEDDTSFLDLPYEMREKVLLLMDPLKLLKVHALSRSTDERNMVETVFQRLLREKLGKYKFSFIVNAVDDRLTYYDEEKIRQEAARSYWRSFFLAYLVYKKVQSGAFSHLELEYGKSEIITIKRLFCNSISAFK